MLNKFIALVVFLFAAKLCFAGNASGTEVEILKAQLEIMKSYDGKILSVVYWALGGFVTGIFALLAFSWFSNRSLIQRDMEVLKEQLNNESKELKTEFSEFRKRLEEDVENKILDATKEALEKQQKLIEIKLEKQLADYKFEITKINLDMTLSEASSWKEKGVYSNSIRGYFKVIELGLALDWKFKVGGALDEICKLLDSWKGPAPKSDDITQFISVLNSLGDDYIVSKEKIKNKFSNF